MSTFEPVVLKFAFAKSVGFSEGNDRHGQQRIASAADFLVESLIFDS